ncbi:hypothetical protein [Leptospira interrogans]|uniref:hypothetical protein n=1 Tax=Leptospira interrogans TaxID=173 RepID=UPI00027864D0|nr:hypothetical protein [Leptospira interrogans]EJP13101.1 hypothetical protein LEP1GSC080_0809 [Leptospira interrogans str. FPW2026]
MKEITLRSSFEFILGKKREDFSDEVKQERWNYWKSLALKNKHRLVEVWSNVEGCIGCIHLDKENAWCNLQGLPCTVNPILSFQNAIPGMACMGAGYTKQSVIPDEFDYSFLYPFFPEDTRYFTMDLNGIIAGYIQKPKLDIDNAAWRSMWRGYRILYEGTFLFVVAPKNWDRSKWKESLKEK